MNKYLTYFLLSTLLFGCRPEHNQTSIDLAELTIEDIHQAFQEGKYNSQNLVQAYIERIENYNDTINAISIINPDAMNSAKLLDEEMAKSGKLRPLHGIPLLVKDNINTRGLPTTAGALSLKDYVPEEDAFIIKKLVDAGAIILAKTNMAEWAFSPMHTESSTVGTTRNPYNLDYVPAGSSGGTGAGIAANFGTIGLGTDTGNSIRGPSAHAALVGFRTTLGLVSRSAIVPLYLRNDVVGPMCRTVKDATRVLEVIAGYDSTDYITRYSEGKIPSNYRQFLNKEGLKGARIGAFRDIHKNPADPEIIALYDRALEDMKQMGATVIDSIKIPNFDELGSNQWCADFRQDIEAFLETYVQSDNLETLEDILRVGTRSSHAESRLALFAANVGRWQNPELPCQDAYQDTLRIAFRSAIEQVMDEMKLDAIVYPSWNNRPARIQQFREEYKGDNNQIISPHTGQPAFTVPMGFINGGLPAGLQFLGRMYDEPTLIRLTYAYEQGTDHRKPPDLQMD
ncbi:MAG: amidase [Bacteroidia bacterium]|nr:amidase [Bacteroidia bacterium]